MLQQVIKDAIALLAWQAKKPIDAASWSEWVVMAVAALDDEQRRGRPMIEGDL